MAEELKSAATPQESNLRNRLARAERELRLFHERELEEPCACDMCVRLYAEDEANGVTCDGGTDE